MTPVLSRPSDPAVDPDRDARFLEIVDELTRRGFLGGALGGAALLGLAACGSDTTATSGATSPSAAATRKVDSVNGKVAVPVDPRRIVTLDGFTMAAMFDLGRNPVGVYSAGEEFVETQFLDRWRPLAKISDGTVGGAVDVEKVAALKPDLILGIDGAKPPYEQLQQVAPTVILPFNASRTPWRDLTVATAAAVGLDSGLASLQQQYADRTAAIRQTYADVLASTRWDILQGGFTAGSFSLYGPGSPIGQILADAGVQFASASAATTDDGGQRSLSYEEIGVLDDADALFYYTTNDGKPANLGPKLVAQKLWQRLDAVRAGRLVGTVYFLPQGYTDAFGALDSLETALKRLA
jgi:iron complex transport system substrate-binding protein